MHILAINPGSSSTKIAVYEDDKPVMLRTIRHTIDDLKPYKEITDQYEFRRDLVISELKRTGIPFNFDAVVGRGGIAKPMEGGVYEVNDKMIYETRTAIHQHPCDLGCIIAYEIANKIPHCRAFIADPGVVDELIPEARISGSPLVPRSAFWHALNQRAIARRFANERGARYEDLNLIVCHLGGGTSIAVHAHGRAIDTNNALDGEGPFSPERTGSLPTADLVRLCYSGRYTEQEMLNHITRRGGLMAHLGTNDMKEIQQRIAMGDEHARLIVDAMIFHTAKCIAAESAVLCGKIDAILLTGGMARSEYIISRLRKRIEFLAPTYCYPGEDELQALAMNALAVLKGEIGAKEYV